MEMNATQKIEEEKLGSQSRPRGRPKKPPQPPKEKPPKPKSEKPTIYKGREKEYLKKYYLEKMCSPCSCQHCNATFTCEKSLTRHLNRNKNCRLKRLTEEIEKLQSSANHP